MPTVLLAGVAVPAPVMEVVVTLEIAVVADDPLVAFADVGREEGRGERGVAGN